MRLWPAIYVAFYVLRGNAIRSVLTVLSVAVGVAAVVCVQAVGDGAQAEVASRLRKLGTKLLIITPGSASSGGVQLGVGTRHTLTVDDAAAIEREVPGVQVSAPLVYRSAQAIAGNKNWSTHILGNNADYLIARQWSLVAGRPFKAVEIGSAAKVAIIGQVIVEKLFDGRTPVGETLRIGTVPFTIVGVLEKKGQVVSGQDQDDNTIIVPLTTATSRLLGGQHALSRRALSYIFVTGDDASSPARLKEQVRELVRQRHRLRREAPDDFIIQNPADVITAQEDSKRIFQLLLGSLAAVTLIVGGIGIMAVMLTSVSERVREIGLRMAVGARRGDIRAQFVVEAVSLAVIGGVIGLLVGSGAAVLMAEYARWPILLSFKTLMVAFGSASLVGVSSGMYPAHRASNLDPIVALRLE